MKGKEHQPSASPPRHFQPHFPPPAGRETILMRSRLCREKLSWGGDFKRDFCCLRAPSLFSRLMCPG